MDVAMDGWIKLHRKIRQNEIFNDHQLLRLWLICLTEASHKERDQIVGKQTVHLMPGEFVTGRFDIADMYNSGLKNKEKVKGEKTVFRWLETLENMGFLTIKKTNKFSIVSIPNWSLYQQTDQENDQQMTIKRPTNDQQMTTNKNVKNVNNENNISTTTDDEASVMSTFTKTFGLTIMPPLYHDYIKKLRESGQSDDTIIELLLEVGESATKPSLRFLQAVGDRWVTEGITSRAQAKALRESQRPTPIVPTTENKRTTKSGKPIIPVVENEFDAKPVSAEEMAELMKLAKSMSNAKKKEAEHEKSA